MKVYVLMDVPKDATYIPQIKVENVFYTLEEAENELIDKILKAPEFWEIVRKDTVNSDYTLARNFAKNGEWTDSQNRYWIVETRLDSYFQYYTKNIDMKSIKEKFRDKVEVVSENANNAFKALKSYLGH